MGRTPLLAVVLAAVSCGGGTTSPSLPTVGGSYGGSVVYRSATPDTHCYAMFLRSLGSGHAYTVMLDVQQNREQIEGTLRGTQIRTTCRFSGRVEAGGAVHWQQSSCSEACTTFGDGPCAAERVCVAAHTFNGLLTGNVLDGSHTVSWDLFDRESGEARGRLDIAGSLRVSR